MKKLLVVVALLLAGCSTGDDAVVRGSDWSFVAPDGKLVITYEGADRKKLGDLGGESLMEPGKQIKLSDYAGQVVVLNIWGAWCGPCRSEVSEFQQLYDAKKADGLQVLGIDVRDDVRSQPEDFVRNQKLTYPSIYDPPGRSLLSLKGYPRNTVPSTIILDRQHRVAAVYLIGILAKDIEPLLKQLTDEPKPA
jgi:peroxiredoxin